jgi:sugar lactone lactonase YvrE
LAALQDPRYIAKDNKGSVYISDYLNHRIRKVDANGNIQTVAGTGIAGFSGDGGPSRTARIFLPAGIAIDSSHNLFFADSGNNRIRKISPAGIITTIAGTGVVGFSGDGGQATAAMVNEPYGLSLDATGNLFFADRGNDRIRKIDSGGVITTVAGSGVAGFAGDGGPATAAELNEPQTAVPGNGGALYIADTNNRRVRKVNASGRISTIAGGGWRGCTDEGFPATEAIFGDVADLTINAGTLVLSNAGCSFVRSIALANGFITTVAGSTTPLGTGGFDGNGHSALTSVFSSPRGIAYDKSGNLLIVDSGNDQVRRVDAGTQIVTVFAGSHVGDNGSGVDASLNFPSGLSFDTSGNVYIVEYYGHRIRKLAPDGTITSLAGTGISGNSGDGGPASAATLDFPVAVASDSTGNVFIADRFGETIRKVDAAGTITTFVPQNSDFFIVAMTTDSSGNVYAADGYSCVIWKITPAGNYTVAAGVPYTCGYNSDEIAATSAFLNTPSGIAIWNGTLLIGDGYNNRVRKVDPNGVIHTIAGTGTCGFSGDGGPAKAAQLCFAAGVAVDGNGTIYVSDEFNRRVRRIGGGNINTLAGTGNPGYNGDGLPATATNLDSPFALTVAPTGVAYVADDVQFRVRKIQ